MSELRVNKLVCSTMLAALLFSLASCGGPYDASVSGVVTLNSAPLTAGTVKFTPQATGPSGYGFVESDGSYSIMTGREDGLPSGPYIVTVVANEPSIPNKDPSLPPTPGKPITPPWYRNPVQSPLQKTVEPGDNEINLELTTQPPAGWKGTRQK
jgi:hypothetical protein